MGKRLDVNSSKTSEVIAENGKKVAVNKKVFGCRAAVLPKHTWNKQHNSVYMTQFIFINTLYLCYLNQSACTFSSPNSLRSIRVSMFFLLFFSFFFLYCFSKHLPIQRAVDRVVFIIFFKHWKPNRRFSCLSINANQTVSKRVQKRPTETNHQRYLFGFSCGFTSDSNAGEKKTYESMSFFVLCLH